MITLGLLYMTFVVVISLCVYASSTNTTNDTNMQFNKRSHPSHGRSIRFCCHFREKGKIYKAKPSLVLISFPRGDPLLSIQIQLCHIFKFNVTPLLIILNSLFWGSHLFPFLSLTLLSPSSEVNYFI